MKITCFDCGQVNRLDSKRVGDGPKCATCGTKLITDKAVELDFATFQKAMRNDDFPLVVDFWAPWCGPCRMMAPEFSRAAGQLKGKARLAKVNTESERQASSKLRISGIPTLIKFKGGKEQKRQAGAMRMGQIVDWAQS